MYWWRWVVESGETVIRKIVLIEIGGDKWRDSNQVDVLMEMGGNRVTTRKIVLVVIGGGE
jgi:hypothetical protein